MPIQRVSALLTVSLFVQSVQLVAVEPGDQPNVVIIMADDLGYGDLGCYGATKISTPHCDRLAREGRRFTDAHTPSGVCSPTRFGLLTGGYPWRENRVPRHLLASEPLVIRDGEPTVASLLKTAGYVTGCIGKWHLGAQRTNPIDWNAPLAPGPNAVGFDSYFGVINSHNQAPYLLVENERIVGLNPGVRIAVEGNQNQTSGPRLRDENALEAVQAAKAVAFIEQYQRQRFFLYYPTAAVHSPITPGTRFVGQSQAGNYGDYVQEFDWAVGEVLAALDRCQLAEKTIVVVTSDNGGIVRMGTPHGHQTCGPWRGEKGTAWEGGHRVPFLVRWPGKVPAGTESSEVICHVDLMATLCAALKIPLPVHAGPDSWNVLPAWLGQPTDRPLREATICVSQQASVFSLRQGPWKLLVSNSSGGAKKAGVTDTELYDLADDPRESQNLAVQQPQRVQELVALLNRYRTQGYTRFGWQAAAR